MGTVAAFLYGWFGGIIAVVVCLTYGFDTLIFVLHLLQRVYAALPIIGKKRSGAGESVIPSALLNADGSPRFKLTGGERQRSLRDEGLEGLVAGSRSTGMPPLKLAASCYMTWYEEARDVTGSHKEFRLVLLGSSLSVYEVLPFGSRGGTSGSGASSLEPRAGSGANALTMAEHLRGKLDISRISVSILKPTHKNKRQASATVFTGHVLLLRSNDGKPLLGSQNNTASTAAPGSDSGNTSMSGDPLSNTQRTNADRVESLLSNNNSFPSRMVLDGWSTIAVKFHSEFETEQWYTALRGLEEVEAWRRFAETMPNPDTANTILSRFAIQNMQGEGLERLLKKAIQTKLKKVSALKLPRDIGGEVKLDDFIIGKHVPWISDVSEPSVSTTGEIGFDFNLQYKGGEEGFSLFFRLDLSFRGIPIPQVVFSVKLLELEASIHVSIGPPPSKKFWIGGHKPPIVRLEVRPGCASGKGVLHHILTALPDLSGMFTHLIKLYLFTDMILPYMDDFPLPSVGKTPPSTPKHRELNNADKQRVFDRRRAAEMSAAPLAGGGSTPQGQATTAVPSMFTSEQSELPDGAVPLSPRSTGTRHDATDLLSPIVPDSSRHTSKSPTTRSVSGRSAGGMAAPDADSSMSQTENSAQNGRGSVGTTGRGLKSMLKSKGSDMSRGKVSRTKVQNKK